ncbi:hypothetical protein LSH36_530g00009 [Paralvinella palmiformis]|uniref:Nostrin n=1 Tax=Paralvinella palmiformis TaxID=53620 RepID=A0AAD9J8X8_9ANNE|nr:hypothetical protein LSH36_530g00009 [Paralvinella palmiformis]
MLTNRANGIVNVRSDAEMTYAKALLKLGQKLNKITGTTIGTLSDAWGLAGIEMETEGDRHKQLGQSLLDDLSKPLKNLADQQNKSRKPIESRVDKAYKCVQERRSEETKYKKNCFASSKEREKMYDQLAAAKAGRGKNMTEKDISKLEKKIRHLDDSLRKMDKEYLDLSQKAESARQEWEYCIYKMTSSDMGVSEMFSLSDDGMIKLANSLQCIDTTHTFYEAIEEYLAQNRMIGLFEIEEQHMKVFASSELQKIEEERIAQMQDLLNKYNSHLSVIGPKMIRSCDKLGEAVLTIDVTSDIRKAIDAKGTGPNQPEQILPDFYSARIEKLTDDDNDNEAEDMLNPMDRERRRQCLQNYLIYLQHDLERELKGKDGVEKLLEVYKNKPNFADAEAQEDSRQKSHQVSVMISFIEAAHYKISNAMAEVDCRPKPSSRFQQFIERTKDKQGQSISILRMPSNALTNGFGSQSGATSYRSPADGGHVEMSYSEAPVKTMLGSFKRQHSKPSAPPPPGPSGCRDSAGSMYSDDEFDDQPGPLCRCRVIYDYVSQQHDELTIKPGDILLVYEKQLDGWWQGELNGQVGIFPATYVEELPM